jgi:F-type H+-transporting ATPase subunit b
MLTSLLLTSLLAGDSMEALGIDLKLLIAQIVNFSILFFLLSRFLYKPITNLLDERKQKIAQGIKDADQAEEKLEKAESEAEKIREKAYKDANDILKNAKHEANQEASEIVKKATEQSQRTMAAIALEKTEYKEKAMNEAKKEMSKVVILALDKIVGEEMDKKTKDELTAKAIKEL